MIEQLNDHWWKGTYIYFRNMGTSKSGKTSIWHVITAASTDPIGIIKWFFRWRRYSFFPVAETVYEETCLREIAQFCETITKEHKNVRSHS